MAQSRALANSTQPHCNTFWAVSKLQDMAGFVLEAIRLNQGGRTAKPSGTSAVWSLMVEARPSAQAAILGIRVKLLLCGSSGKMTFQCHARFWGLTLLDELGVP